MAQRVKIILVDDVDGGTADETVRFGLDGNSYEIDLSAENAQKFRGALEEYLSVARRVTGGGKAPKRAAAKSQDTAQIRKWALDNGYKVSSRGRVHADIIEAYHKAIS
ncbi:MULTISPECIES: Lsr2 family protein [Arthrobacter]|uniref:Lsr2 family protein n=2 Tax=Arthrobacter TaxID=1663 RepID=A0ABU9KK77_9MICC|nr:Lsr2 family protein [Arthrobacter sp. YJM1]MDP5227004.1 Lsr2 family protein [Arthrobacter sp. YJM1]